MNSLFIESFRNIRSESLGLVELAVISTKGTFDCLIVRRMLEKPVPNDYKDYNNYQIARKCADRALIGTDKKNPWESHEFPIMAPAGSTPKYSGLVEYDESGNASGMNKKTLESQGYADGSMVVISGADEGQTRIHILCFQLSI